MKTILVSVLESVILAISVLLVSGRAVTEKSFNETYGQPFLTAQWLVPGNDTQAKLGFGSGGRGSEMASENVSSPPPTPRTYHLALLTR